LIISKSLSEILAAGAGAGAGVGTATALFPAAAFAAASLAFAYWVVCYGAQVGVSDDCRDSVVLRARKWVRQLDSDNNRI
jgi:hypothetical protein